LLSSANSDNLWAAMQTALESSNIHNFNVKEMMNSWTQLTRYPVLNVTQHNSSYVRISLENYNPLYQKIPWIPVTWITQKTNNDLHRYPMMWFKPDHDKENAFIRYNKMIINFQQTGKF